MSSCLFVGLALSGLFEKAGLNVPTIFESDVENGFLLLSDLGRYTYLDVLNEDNARDLMLQAIDALVKWQLISEEGVLPEYNREVLSRELNLFPEWYIAKHRQKVLDDRQAAILKMCFERILQNNLAQPKVFVHRDFMPRNLMAVADNGPGILDYQDALYGPISYDIASLLRDVPASILTISARSSAARGTTGCSISASLSQRAFPPSVRQARRSRSC